MSYSLSTRVMRLMDNLRRVLYEFPEKDNSFLKERCEVLRVKLFIDNQGFTPEDMKELTNLEINIANTLDL